MEFLSCVGRGPVVSCWSVSLSKAGALRLTFGIGASGSVHGQASGSELLVFHTRLVLKVFGWSMQGDFRFEGSLL